MELTIIKTKPNQTHFSFFAEMSIGKFARLERSIEPDRVRQNKANRQAQPVVPAPEPESSLPNEPKWNLASMKMQNKAKLTGSQPVILNGVKDLIVQNKANYPRFQSKNKDYQKKQTQNKPISGGTFKRLVASKQCKDGSLWAHCAKQSQFIRKYYTILIRLTY